MIQESKVSELILLSLVYWKSKTCLGPTHSRILKTELFRPTINCCTSSFLLPYRTQMGSSHQSDISLPRYLNTYRPVLTCWNNGAPSIPTVHYSDSPLFRQPNIPTAHYSDSPLFRQPIIPTAHYSDSPLFRQPIIPTAHYSDSPLFRQPIIPTAHYSDSTLFRHDVQYLRGWMLIILFKMVGSERSDSSRQ